MPPRLAATYLGIGVLVTLHWISFYGSIKAVERVGRGHVHGAHAGVRVDHRAVAGAPPPRTSSKWR
jgi:hypothetical protein